MDSLPQWALGPVTARRMGPGVAADDASGCDECYAYGVICALLGASLQAVGLQLWKLHYLRAEQAAVEEVEFIARSISEEVSRREELAETKDLLSDKHDEAAFSEHKGALDAVDLSVVTDEHDTGYAADIKNSASFLQVIRHVRNHSNHSIHSSTSQASGDVAAGVDMVRASLARSSRPPGAKGAGHAHQRDDTDDIVLDADGYTPSERDCAADAVSLASVHGKLEGATFAHANGVGFELNSKEQFAHRVYMPSCLWTAGFSVFLVGNVLDFIALGLTKVSIVTLVGSGSLVVNTVMARLLLKEIVTTLDIMSAVCIILGISLTVIGNQSEVKEWPVEELVQQYSRPDVVVMLVMFTGVIVTCLLIMAMDTTRRRAVAARTGVAPRPSRWIGAITCIVGAFVATFTILFGKAFSNLILLTIAGDNQFTDIITVLIVLAFMVSLPAQLVLINMSLAINDALMHIPNFYVFWNLGSIICGAIFYHELEQLSMENLIIFFLGVCVLIFAVTLTNISGARKQHALGDVRSQYPSLHTYNTGLPAEDFPPEQGGGRGRLMSGGGVLPPPAIKPPTTLNKGPAVAYLHPPVSPGDGSSSPPAIPFPSAGGVVTSPVMDIESRGTSPWMDTASHSRSFRGLYISATASLGGFHGLQRAGGSYTYRIPVKAPDSMTHDDLELRAVAAVGGAQ